MSKAREFRENAKQLEQRADVAADEKVRSGLRVVARRWREFADDIERYEPDDPQDLRDKEP